MAGHRPRPPKTLGDAGKALWRRVHGDLPDDWELDERELAILGLAGRQADDLAKLEANIERVGVTVRGSQGQMRPNPLVAEARQARMSIAKLLGELKLPDEAGDARNAASRRGQAAAQARWAGHELSKRRWQRGT